MTLEQLQEYVKQHLDSYGDGFIGEDELPEDFTLVEDDDWTQEHKYQYHVAIYKDGEGNYFQIQNTRSGSYHTDWYYGEPYINQVKRVEKVVTKTVVSWEAV
jgi:hypothetical protein